MSDDISAMDSMLKILLDRTVLPVNGYWTQVLRVESKEHGYGPYISAGSSSWGDRDESGRLNHNNMRTHPTPYEDGIPQAPYHWMHGIIGMDKFLAWFSPTEREKLDAMGYVLAVYEVPVEGRFVGRKQVVFCPERAKKLKTVPLTTPLEALAA